MELRDSTRIQLRDFFIRFFGVSLFAIVALGVGNYYGVSALSIGLVLTITGLLIAIWTWSDSHEMTTNDIRRIVYESEPEDWDYQDSDGLYTFRGNVNLRLEDEDYQNRVDFDEPWVRKYSNPTAYRRTISIYYNSTLIDKETIIQADEYRVFIPIPTPTSHTITSDQYQLGKIINYSKEIDGPRGDHIEEFDEYLRIGGITMNN